MVVLVLVFSGFFFGLPMDIISVTKVFFLQAAEFIDLVFVKLSYHTVILLDRTLKKWGLSNFAF